ncbi:MAG: flagellin-like protein [Sphingomonadaceae bacterium]|nr:flagellin-like protein [Sphingomonadaceae bacterium]
MLSATQGNMQAEVARQNQLSSDIAKLQIEVSTGKRIQQASDDPGAAAQLASIRQTQANQSAWQSNVNTASATASAADSTMSNIATALTRVQELLISANSSTATASDRASAAAELSGIAQDITSYEAQTDANGQPLFPSTALAVPIGQNEAVAATPSKADVFTITQADGSTIDLSTFVANAAATLSSGNSSSADLTTIGNAITQTADARAAQGVRESRISDAGTRLTDSATALNAQQQTLQATDITQTVADLQSKMTTLQAAQALLVKVTQTNLFSMIN